MPRTQLFPYTHRNPIPLRNFHRRLGQPTTRWEVYVKAASIIVCSLYMYVHTLAPHKSPTFCETLQPNLKWPLGI